jgi:hypothetical protein
MEETELLLDKLGTVLLIKASAFFNDLSVGIETTADKSVDQNGEGDTARQERVELPALTLPQDETLRWALEHFGEELEALTTEMTGQPFITLADIHRDMGNEVGEAIERTFQSLTRTLGKQDRPRARRTVQRAQAALAFQANKTLTTFAQEQLPLQQKLIESTLLKFRSQARKLVRHAPEELKPLVSPQNSQENGESARKLPWRHRLMNSPPRVRIPFRDLVEVRVNEDYHRLVAEAVERLCGAAHIFSEEVLLQLQNTFDALQRIEKDIEDGEATTLADEQLNIERALEDMLRAHELRQQSIRQDFQFGTRKLVQRVAEEVDNT